MWRRQASCGAVVLALILIGGDGHAAAGAAGADGLDDGAHIVGLRVVDGAAELFDRRDGSRLAVRGANYVFRPSDQGGRSLHLFRVGGYDPDLVRRDFAALAERGYDSVRVFLDLCDTPDGEGCIGRVGGTGLDRGVLANIADLTHAAAEADIFVLLTSNDMPDQGGYAKQANAIAGATFAGYRNAYYLTPQAIAATRRYWRDLITGLKAESARLDHVLAWELVNEQWMFEDQPPLSLRDGEVTTTTGTYDMSRARERRSMVADGLVHYGAEMRDEILRHDPTALVAMGFFPPDAVPGWYTDPVAMLERSDLDIIGLHLYPGAGPPRRPGRDRERDRLDPRRHPDKVVLLGEYGAFRHVFPDIEAAAAAVTRFQALTCRSGFDGYLYWTYLAADESVGDATWGLTDEGGLLLDLLSPDAHPDPCEEIAVERSNKALGATVRASRSTRGEPPGRVVDDRIDTPWIAGADPPQSISLRFPEPIRLAELHLLVSQSPAGRTRHLVEVRRGRDPDFRRLALLDGRTVDGDWLVVRPRRPATRVREVRITTLAGPSWVSWHEIRAWEEPQAAPGSAEAEADASAGSFR